MKLIAAVLLCGVVALTYADGQCGCDALKQCVDEQKQAMKTMFQECHEMCEPELGDAAEAVQMCFQNMTSHMAQFEQNKQSCLFDPANHVCGAARIKRGDFMFRQRHGKHHEVSSSEAEDESNDEMESEDQSGRRSKHRKHHGKGHKNEEEEEGSSSESKEEMEDEESWGRKGHGKHGKHGGKHHGGKHGKHGKHGKQGGKCGHHESALMMKMKPFHSCLRSCFQEKHEMAAKQHRGEEHQSEWKEEHGRQHESAHRRPKHHKGGHHFGGWWMMKCEHKLNCTVSKTATMVAMKTCHTKSQLTRGNMFEMKAESCECLRDAFKIDKSEMPCDPAHHEGIHHHWNGGDRNVHHGSHFY